MKFLVLVSILAVAAANPLGAFRPETRIIGGTNATKGQYPYQISYQHSDASGSNTHFCGGSILTPSWVLTAAHCITETPTGVYHVVAGILNLDDRENGQIVKVVQTIVHPNYTGGVVPSDIALVRLATPLEFNDLVQPISLPKADSDPFGDAVLTGWGVISTTNPPIQPKILQTIDLPIISNTDCKKALDRIMGSVSNPFDGTSNICSGNLTIVGKAVCHNDSGGPLAQDGILIGVVSWGVVPCGSLGAPSVFTRVSSFLDFIKKNVHDLP